MGKYNGQFSNTEDFSKNGCQMGKCFENIEKIFKFCEVLHRKSTLNYYLSAENKMYDFLFQGWNLTPILT